MRIGNIAMGPASEHVQREHRIIAVLVALEPGEVTTYGDIADVAGYPRQARLVGRVLSATRVEVPWWRVVNASRRLVPGHESEQATLLRSEGAIVDGTKLIRAPLGRFSSRSLAR